MGILFRILFSGQNRLPIVVASLGTFIGLVILLSSLHIYSQVQQSVEKRLEEQQQSGFLIINKQLSPFSGFGGNAGQFSEAEIADLAEQPFAKNVGIFKSNTFRVIAGLGQTLGLQGDMFLEAVEDQYLDILPEEWVWDESKNFVPIMVSGEFMRLYNFSIAMSQNLPQISPSMVKMISFDMKIPYEDDEMVYEARVVGFSDRLPTILVPYDFLNYANERFGTVQEKKPSRVIVEVADPSDPRIETYLTENELETNKEALRGGTGETIIRIIMAITGTIGILFLILSLVLFIMNFQLILSRAKEEISMLLDLGYQPSYLNKILMYQFLMFITPVILFSLAIVYGVSVYASNLLESAGWGSEGGPASVVWFTALGFAGVSLLLNFIVINKNIKGFYK